LGAVVNVHCENGDAVAYLQSQLIKDGVTGPEGHPLSRPTGVEAEATNRVISIAKITDTPVYIVHVSCREALEAVSRARLGGQCVYAEALGAHLLIDDSVYASSDFDQAAGFVMSPPFRPKGHCAALWNGLQAGHIQVVASDHVTFNKEQKRMGLSNFAAIPNGTGGVEDRMSLVWDEGVRNGRLTPEEFVAVTSTNAAKIYNLWPRKGLIAQGADADLVVWNPHASRTISAATHHHATDFSIFEGKTVTGIPSTTIARGRVVYSDGQLRAERGAGRQIKRHAFGAAYAATSHLQSSRKSEVKT
jgi:dihydropyrimidinase